MAPDTAAEVVEDGGSVVAMIVRRETAPAATSFVTSDTDDFQLGFVVYPAGGEVVRHVHKPLRRKLVGTSEVLMVRSGRCEVDLYDGRKALIATRELRAGDVILLLSGGHGIRMLEDTTFLEVKQGPYTGLDEKERF